MPLQSVIGHRSVLKLIARAIGRDTLPPSLLFSGPGGVGKWLSATAVAQALNCLKPLRSDDFDNDACGSCSSCLRIARHVHSDVITIEPGETGSIKVEQVRDAIGRTAFRPFEGRKRAVIVHQADAMVPAAQSALLKSLEEPPPASVFILTSAMPDALLPTVRSRCSVLRFRPLTVAEVATVLIRDHGYKAGDAQSAALDAEGSVARALERSAVDLVEARAVAQRLLERVAHTTDAVRRIEIAEIIKVKNSSPADERNRLAVCLRILLSLLRDVGVIASGADTRLLANTDVETGLRQLAAAFDADRSRRGFTSVADAIVSLDRNASPKLVADWLVLQL